MPPEQNEQEHFVKWFRTSSPYIRAHSGRTFVIAFGGEAVESAGFAELCDDIALLNSLGIKLVLVHGARPQIEGLLRERDIPVQYAQGMRITDDRALPSVREAVGSVRMAMEALLSKGLTNAPGADNHIRVSSGNFVIARPIGVREGVDFCHTGEVRRIDGSALKHHLHEGQIVLLSPIGYSPTGEMFNVSAEDIASAVAIHLNAHKLIYVTDGEAGVGVEGAAPVNQLTPAQAEELIEHDQVHAEHGRRCLENAIRACRSGVRRAHIVGRERDGALLLELFTRDGIGTLVTNEAYEGFRQAGIDDVGGILNLLGPLEESGVLVRRSRELLEMEIDRFTVIERDGMIVGCAGLYPYPADGMAELACLAVHPDYRQTGRGDAMLEHIQQQARGLSIDTLFVLTTRSAHWFMERGFQSGSTDDLPMEKKALYNRQRNSKVLLKSL